MDIRKSTQNDLPRIMEIYAYAREYMASHGNPNQWGHFYPSEDLIRQDIKEEVCHVISDDEDIHAVFALFNGTEPTYEYSEYGEWLNDDEYVTVHRIASDGKLHGIFKFTIDYCKSITDNIRIYTHSNNLIMQKQIEKNGFEKIGPGYVADLSSF
jgi:hypothetical protein